MNAKLKRYVASIAATGVKLLATPRLIAALILPVLLWAMPSPATAFDGDTPKFGGGGGAEFHTQCPWGAVLAGFSYVAGKDLDSIQMKCRGRQVTKPIGPETDVGPMFGRNNDNGQYKTADTLTCPSPMIVQGMSVTRSATVGLVHTVRFTCRNPQTGQKTDTGWVTNGGGRGGNTEYADCGDNGYAIGLWGASGALIDALGLTCAEYRRMPKPVKHSAHGGPSGIVPSIPDVEDGIDRPGNDIARFVLTTPDFHRCQRACRDSDKCEAWTFVKPNIQGPNAVCYLKNPAPGPRPNDCCVSGGQLPEVVH